MDMSLFTVPQIQMTKNDHYTPKWVFDLLDVEFDLDVAAPPGGVPWIPAKRYYTQADDGLAQPWEGLVWCNPPFNNILPWVNRLNEHRNGIALFPQTKGKWREEVWAGADGLVENKKVNQMQFHYLGRKDKCLFHTLFIAAWGEVGIEALSNIGRVR